MPLLPVTLLEQRIRQRLQNRPLLSKGVLAIALDKRSQGLPVLTVEQKQAIFLSALASSATAGILFFGLKQQHRFTEQQEIFAIPAISTVVNNIAQILLKAKIPNL